MAKAKRQKTRKKTDQLNERQKKFCQYYVELGNGQQAALKAGYSEQTARHQASQLLTKEHIKNEITRLAQPLENTRIMSGQEAMEHLTAIARNEEKDQFGIDIGAGDRLKALVEILKRTVDVENRQSGTPDQTISIQLDWGRDDDE